MRDYQTKANVGALPDSIVSTKFGAGEFNSIAQELENAVLPSGQTLADAAGTSEAVNQLALSLFHHATRAQTFVDSGTANAYVLTPINGATGFQLPNSLTLLNGMRVTFFPANANTGAATLNIGQTGGTLLGAKPLRTNANVALTAGIVGLRQVSATYSLSLDAWLLEPAGMNATETERGVLEVSSAAEQAAGTDHTTAMTPLRVRGALQQFGIANLQTPIISGSLDAVLTSGLYSTDAGVTTDFPAGANQTGFLLVATRAGNTRVLQKYMAADLREYVRVYNAGTLTWGAWSELWVGRAATLSAAASGYQFLPSGLLFQWGLTSVGTATSGSITLPTSFPTAFYTGYITPAGAADLGRFQVVNGGLTNIAWTRFGSTTSGSVYYFVIGS